MIANGLALAEKKRAAWYAELLLRALPLADTLEEAVAAVEVALSHNPEPDAEVSAMFGWVATNTTDRNGLPGWKNTETGEYRYQKTWPGTPRTTRQEEPATPRAPKSVAATKARTRAPQGFGGAGAGQAAPAKEVSSSGGQGPEIGSTGLVPPEEATQETDDQEQPQGEQPQAPAEPQTPSPSWTAARAAVQKHFGGALSVNKLPPEKAGDYASAAASVFDRMSENALRRFQAGTQVAYFAPDGESLNRAAGRDNVALAEKMKKGLRVAGMYGVGADRKGRLYLDGDAGKIKTRDIYAHEFMHVVDGKDFEISGSDEWKAAWSEEIKDKGISRYAWTDEREGLAEFGRLIWSHPNVDQVLAYYPKVAAVLRKFGVI